MHGDDESADKWQGYLDALLWVERELLRKKNA